MQWQPGCLTRDPWFSDLASRQVWLSHLPDYRIIMLNREVVLGNWRPNSLGREAGHHFVACASVSGYDDPASELTVFAKDENGNAVELRYDWGNWFCRLVENDLKNEGVSDRKPGYCRKLFYPPAGLTLYPCASRKFLTLSR
jgi:hypothetical protein